MFDITKAIADMNLEEGDFVSLQTGHLPEDEREGFEKAVRDALDETGFTNITLLVNSKEPHQ